MRGKINQFLSNSLVVIAKVFHLNWQGKLRWNKWTMNSTFGMLPCMEYILITLCWKWNDQQIIEAFSIQRQNIIVWSFFTLRAILVNRVMYVITTLITVIHIQTLYMIFLILLTFLGKHYNAHTFSRSHYGA